MPAAIVSLLTPGPPQHLLIGGQVIVQLLFHLKIGPFLVA